MFLYKKVYSSLKDSILSGHYSFGSLLPAERELVSEYSVDRSTIRKAIELLEDEGLLEKRQGRKTMVCYSAKKSIKTFPSKTELADDVDENTYMQVIAFLLPLGNNNEDRISIEFYSQLFSECERLFKKQGYSVFYSSLDDEDIDGLRKRLGNSLVGIIFVSDISEKYMYQAINYGIPAVLLNSYTKLLPSIISDNFSGMIQATEHLIELGHRDIAVVNGVSDHVTAIERLRGVEDAMLSAGLKLRPKNIIEAKSWEYEEAVSAVDTYLSSVEKIPTAIIAFNDRLASGTIKAITLHNLKVPDDISVIGFDNSSLSNYTDPKLSSVDINVDLLAKNAFISLYHQLRFKERIPAKILVPVSYCEKCSVKSIYKEDL